MCMTVSMSMSMCDMDVGEVSRHGEGGKREGMWMSIRCEYFDKWLDWTLKHFIWHVVDAMGREGGGRRGGEGGGFGHCVGQCVAFWSFIWTLVLFHCQLLCWLSRSTESPALSLPLCLSICVGWEWVCGYMREHASLCVYLSLQMCVCVQPQTKGRLREHIMANDRLAKSQWTFVTELQNAQCQRRRRRWRWRWQWRRWTQLQHGNLNWAAHRATDLPLPTHPLTHSQSPERSGRPAASYRHWLLSNPCSIRRPSVDTNKWAPVKHPVGVEVGVEELHLESQSRGWDTGWQGTSNGTEWKVLIADAEAGSQVGRSNGHTNRTERRTECGQLEWTGWWWVNWVLCECVGEWCVSVFNVKAIWANLSLVKVPDTGRYKFFSYCGPKWA